MTLNHLSTRELLSAYYPESKYGGFTDIDGTILFYLRVNALINSSSVVLDVGCGRGAHAEDPIPIRRELRIFKGKCAETIGIDVDETVKDNPFLDEFRLMESSRWPLEDESVDVCMCDNVLEHIEDPELFFSESKRVIKPGGYLCVRTPNALNYIAVFSKLIPNKYHASVISKVQDGRKEVDVFPTYYRCNTRRRIRHMLAKHGFDSCVYGYESEPSYLSLSRVSYFLGVMHQKLAPSLLRASIFAFGRKNKGI